MIGALARDLVVAAVMGAAAQAIAAAKDAPPAAPRVELSALVAEALANNPEIRAADQRLGAARAAVPPARTLPDPVLNFSYEDMDVDETMYGVSQEIPFPGKLRLKGEVAQREADSEEQQYLATRLRVVARLKEACYDLGFAYQSAAVIDRTRLLLVQVAQAADAGYAVGRMAQADVFRAQAEISRSLARLAVVRQRRESASAEVSRLLNRPPGQSLGEPGPFHAVSLRRSEADILAVMEERSPLLLAEMRGLERGDAAVELAKREYFPDFEIGVQGVREEPMRDTGYQVMLNVTVPLYYANKQRYGVREAQAMRAETAGDLQAMRQELAMRIRDNVAQIERARRLIDLLTNAIIPQAQLTLESARAGYSVGRVDFLTLLNSLLTLQENEIERYGEIAEHEKARARLEEIIGEEP